MMRSLIFSISFFFCFVLMSGDLTVEEFLRSSELDHRLMRRKEVFEVQSSSKADTPVLRSMEFRTRIEEFDFKKTRYELRFYPRGFGETVAASRYRKEDHKQTAMNIALYFDKTVRRRASLILDYLEVDLLIKNNEKMLEVVKDRVSILRQRNSHDMDFDVTALIEAENKLANLRLDAVTLEESMERIKFRIHQIAGNRNINFCLTPIDAGEIEKIVDKMDLDVDETNALNPYRQAIVAENFRYEYERSKSRRYVKHFSVRYDLDDFLDDRKHREAFALSASFNLPFVSSDRERLSRMKARIVRKEFDYIEERERYQEEVFALKSVMRRLLGHYRILTQRKNEGSAELSLNRYLSVEGLNPETLLSIREHILQSEKKLIETEIRIRKRLLRFIDINGEMSHDILKAVFGVENVRI